MGTQRDDHGEPLIRRARAGDLKGVATTVRAAFAQDPAWAFIFGESYERVVPHFVAALFEVRLASNGVWVSDDLATTAMWDPPQKAVGGSELAERVWTRYSALAGEEATARLATYNAAVAAAVREPAQHWYLGVLATHPQRRREGLASSVIAPVLEQADQLGLSCCLETSTAENRRFYEGRGFTEATDIVLPGGPPTWWLRRPPVQS